MNQRREEVKRPPITLIVTSLLIVVVWVFYAGGMWRVVCATDKMATDARSLSVSNERHIAVVDAKFQQFSDQQAQNFERMDQQFKDLGKKIDGIQK